MPLAVELTGELAENVAIAMDEYGSDLILEALEEVFDDDRNCNDDLCDDEGCVLRKAFLNYINHNKE